MPTLEQLDAAMAREWLHVPAVQQLGGGDISVTNDGRPWRIVGTDAAVYQLRPRDGKLLALRCPFSDTFDEVHAVQYDTLSRDNDVKRDWLAGDIHYFPQGLKLTRKGFRSEGYPVISMEWIEGRTLRETVEQACDIGHHRVLSTLAREWLSLMDAMDRAGFVHCDLNAENTIVGSNGRLRLVDYDTSTWPRFPTVPIGFGTAGYVHPRATPRTPGSQRDAFAALVVFVSLQSLAVRPEIWNRTRDRRARAGHGLLFTSWDLAHVRSSPLFADLEQAEDQQVREWVSALADICDGAADMIPRLEDIVDVKAQPFTPPAELWAHRDHNQAPETGGVGAGGWHEGDRWSSREHEATRATDRRTARAALVERVVSAVDARDGEAVARLWPRVRGDRRVSAIAILAADILQQQFGKKIADAMRREDDHAIVASVREAEAAGVAVTASTRRAARRSARRISMRERLRAAIGASDQRAIAEIALSPDFVEIQPLDEETSGAIGHALALVPLHRALRADDDVAIAAAARDDERLDLARLDDQVKVRVELAIQRIDWGERVRRALREKDAEAIDVAFRADPGGARERLGAVDRSRAERLVKRERAIGRMHRALGGGSDEAVLEAMNDIMATGAPLPITIDWTRVRKAADHVVLIEALREAMRSAPPDYGRLARLLPAARSLSRDIPSLAAEFDLGEIEHMVLSENQRRRLAKALETENDAEIAAVAFPDAYGILPTLKKEQRARVAQAAKAAGRR